MRRLLAVVVLSAVLASPLVASAQQDRPPLDEWRTAYEASLRAEYGWLSVAGLWFLEPGANTVGSLAGSDIPLPAGHAPLEVGRIVLRDGEATLVLRPGISAAVGETLVTGTVRLNPDEEQLAPRVRVGDVEFHLHRSGERLGIRVRDPQSPLRTDFAGTRWFEAKPDHDVVGTLRRSSEPRTVPVHNVLGDVETYTSPGVLTFQIDGRALELVPFAASRDRLWLIFRDGSAGRETYGTRFLYAEPLGGDRYRVDFNRTYNPPCAYNPHTTCPTPLRENVLPVAIQAGERLYQPPSPLTARR